MNFKEIKKITDDTFPLDCLPDYKTFSLAVLKDGTTLATGSYDKIKLWNTTTGELIKSFITEQIGFVNCISHLEDGTLACGSQFGTASIWNISTGELIRTFSEHKPVFNEIEKVGHPYEDEMIPRTSNTPGAIYCLAQLKDGNIASGSMDSTIIIWDPKTGKSLKTLTGHTDYVNSLVVLPDDKLASASSDKSIIIWNTNTGTLISKLGGAISRHQSDVCCLVLLPNGELASGSADKIIKFWDYENQCVERTLIGHTGTVTSLVVLKDGRLLSGSDDKTIRTWSINSGQLLTTFNTDAINSLVLLQNDVLATASFNSNEIKIRKETEEAIKTNKDSKSCILI